MVPFSITQFVLQVALCVFQVLELLCPGSCSAVHSNFQAEWQTVGKNDKLIVSVADYFNDATFTVPTVSNEFRFQKGLLRI
jgi:hypothetical protein